jgi:putative protease
MGVSEVENQDVQTNVHKANMQDSSVENIRKMELLAPAGNMKAFNAAVNAGADSVYLGVERFSARKGAGNFSIAELKEAVTNAHLHDVKVYVAFNTIISDDEMPDAARTLNEIYNCGIDAVIVQDWGVYSFIKKALPDLNIHVSTQMNAHNSEMVKFAEAQGAKRVTLARELSIDEISAIKNNTGVEIECFIHGALCFSYSGQCLFSSLVGNRSGNRGMCPQACRLSYELELSPETSPRSKKPKRVAMNQTANQSNEYELSTSGKHILSTRDLCGIKLIPQLADAGVTALKIEGRMKAPEYVAIVVNAYRRAIDRYYEDPSNFKISDEDISELREVFSRGFSESYLAGIRDERMMGFERPSDRGVFIGRVTYLDIYKAKLGLELKTDLYTGDEIEVWVTQGGRIKIKVAEMFVNGKKASFAQAGSKVAITVSEKRHKIRNGDRVFRIRSEMIEKKAKEIMSSSHEALIPIGIRADISIGKPVSLEVWTMNQGPKYEAQIHSDFKAEAGQHRTLSKEDVVSQLNRLGNTAYSAEYWDIKAQDGVMVPLGKLNELRRTVIDLLDEKRIAAAERPKIKVKETLAILNKTLHENKATGRRKSTKKPSIAVDVSSVEQAERAAMNGANWIYLRPGLSRFQAQSLRTPDRARITADKSAEKESGLFKAESLYKLEDAVSAIKSKHGIKFALATTNILHDDELNEFMKYLEKADGLYDAVLADNFGVINAIFNHDDAKEHNPSMPIFIDYHINVFNGLAVEFFRRNAANRICMSTELTIDQIYAIASSMQKESKVELEAIVHGWLEVMTAEHCVPSASKKSCSLCKSNSFIAEDQKGFRFPIEQDVKCRSHIYNSRELYLLQNIPAFVDSGVSSIRLLLNRYSPEDAGKATSLYREAIDLISQGSRDMGPILDRAEKILPSLRQPTTSGHYFRAVQ